MAVQKPPQRKWPGLLIVVGMILVIVGTMTFLKVDIRDIRHIFDEQPAMLSVYVMEIETAQAFCVKGCEDAVFTQQGVNVLLYSPRCTAEVQVPKARKYQPTMVFDTKEGSSIADPSDNPYTGVCMGIIAYQLPGR